MYNELTLRNHWRPSYPLSRISRLDLLDQSCKLGLADGDGAVKFYSDGKVPPWVGCGLMIFTHKPMETLGSHTSYAEGLDGLLGVLFMNP
jgi:hypothetical protein